MDYRKIIKFGNSSHVISLPSKWLEKNKLNKGDVVYYEENGNGELIVSPTQSVDDNKSKDITIDITNKDTQRIKREIISAYINDFNLVRIIGKELSEKADEIRTILHDLAALEIMEQTSSRIVAKDFLSIDNASIKNLIRKIDIIVRGMILDCKKCLDLNSAELPNSISNIVGRDLDVNRLTFLVFRIIRKCAKNPRISAKLGMNNIDLIEYWKLSVSLEMIADETKRICRFINDLNLKKDSRQKFYALIKNLEENYLNAMKAYHTSNKELAFEVAASKIMIRKACNDFVLENPDNTVVRIIEKMKRMDDHTGDIARIVYNTLG